MAKKMTATTELLIPHIAELGFKPFYHKGEGDIVMVSAENGDDAADYYGEFRGGYPWINPKLEELATKLHCFWEWQNPGCIALYHA